MISRQRPSGMSYAKSFLAGVSFRPLLCSTALGLRCAKVDKDQPCRDLRFTLRDFPINHHHHHFARPRPVRIIARGERSAIEREATTTEVTGTHTDHRCTDTQIQAEQLHLIVVVASSGAPPQSILDTLSFGHHSKSTETSSPAHLNHHPRLLTFHTRLETLYTTKSTRHESLWQEGIRASERRLQHQEILSLQGVGHQSC